ncbi:MAG: type II toxin-antitoxin system HicA family toxin [Synergistaceae bacterium]|nr:type II toxin-antitoxin system HicA family toxin [Synergistaceae bacterium]
MTTLPKVFAYVMSGRKDNNITFDELQRLLDSLGFQHRIKGSHHIYWHKDIEEIINIQPDGNKAKAYQVKQVRNIILRYDLKI